MWLALMLVLPLSGLELILIPILLWRTGPASWHPLLLIAFAVLGGFATVSITLWYLRGTAERQSNPAARASWLWQKGLPPDQFRAQLSLYLRMHGWRVLSSGLAPGDRVEIALSKDRWSVVLLCAGPDQCPTSDGDLERLRALRREAGATYAAFVWPGRRNRFAPGRLQVMTLSTPDASEWSAVKLALGLN